MRARSTYCASRDEAVITEGLQTVKTVLTENYVRPDEAEKVKSTIRERGRLKVIDKVTVKLNEKRDVYEALLSNLGTKGVEVGTHFVKQYEKLLAGGIWCIVTLSYFYEEGQKGVSAKFFDDLGDLPGGHALDRYLGQSQAARLLATDTFFHGAGIKFHVVTNLGNAKPDRSEAGRQRFWFEAIGAAQAGFATLVGAGLEHGGVLLDHGFVDERGRTLGETQGAFVGEKL